MRIIKAAKRKDEIIITCPHCNSVIGVGQNDLYWSCSRWRCTCPVCSDNMDVGEDKEDLFPWLMEDEHDRELQGDNTMWVNPL